MVRVRAVRTAEVQVGQCRIFPTSAVRFAAVFYLASNAGERITRARLLELLWPGVPDSSRRHALRQVLYRLRRNGLMLALDGEELLLDAAQVDSDLSAVLDSGWPASAAVDVVIAAGAVLPGYFPAISQVYLEWLDELRARIEAQYRHAVLLHLARAKKEGRWVDVAEWARRCLAVDPLNEEATLARAEALVMSGSKTRALDLLDEYRDELGDREKTIGLPAKVLTRRISEHIVSRSLACAPTVPFVGREAEIARLNELVALAGEGRRSAAMVVGAPGIGKSTLTQQLVDSAIMRGRRSISVRLHASDAHRPLAAFVELFTALLRLPGAIGSAPASLVQLQQLTQHDVDQRDGPPRSREAEAVQERIRAAAVDLLGAVCDEGPLILVLEDLHWVDASSTRFLLHLVERTSSLPVFWLLTARQEARYAELRDTLSEELVETLRLGPLREHDAVALFRSLADRSKSTDEALLVDFSDALTGGNPFFIREVARHYVETGSTRSIPSSLRAVIHDRVARLSQMSRNVVHACAILGRYSSVPRLAGVLEIGTLELLACLEDLDALGILGVGREADALAMHDLWQEELLSSIRPASRQVLHHRCGAVLESESSRTRSASMVWEAARHLIASGANDRALSLLEDCARHQLENGLPVDAAQTFELAFNAAMTDTERFRTMSGRIAALNRAAKWNELADVIGPAITLSERCTPKASEHSELELLQIECLWRTEVDSMGCLERALTCVLDENASEGHRAGAALIASTSAANLAQWTALDRVNTIAGRLACRSLEDRVRVLSVQIIFHTEIGSLDQGLQHAERLITLERDMCSIRGLLRASRFAANTLISLGQFERAVALLRTAQNLAENQNLAHEACSAADVLATIHVERNDVRAAEFWLERAEVWAAGISAHYARDSLNSVRVMVALASNETEKAASLVDANLDAVCRDPLVRKRVAKLSILARVLASTENVEKLAATLQALRCGLEQSITTCRNDYVVASFALGMNALGKKQEACSYVRKYVLHARRDRSALSSELAGFLPR